jgi:hypothetical protein
MAVAHRAKADAHQLAQIVRVSPPILELRIIKLKVSVSRRTSVAAGRDAYDRRAWAEAFDALAAAHALAPLEEARRGTTGVVGHACWAN